MGFQGSMDYCSSNLAPLVNKMIGGQAFQAVACVANNIDAVAYLAAMLQGSSISGANLAITTTTPIGATAVNICPARVGIPGVGRRSVTIKNTNPAELYIVTTFGVGVGGFPIDPGDVLILNNTADVFAYYPPGNGTATALEDF